MPNLDKRKEQEVFDPIELRDMLVEKGMVGSLVKNLSREEMMAILDAFTDMKQAKAKGGNIAKQMELFQDGGLKDEGGTKDPVSGNEVPPGATQEEVRDDIPAQLSEGEFVFPADVVRYIGLEKLMRMRQEAKMGLKMMEEMGQMGNADEATIPDDIPFSVIDIQIAEGDDDDDEVEKRAEGGVIKAANGFAGTTTPYRAPEAPSFAKPVTGFTYTSPTSQKGDEGGFTFEGLMGGKELSQGPDEYKTYVNDAGAEIQVPFKNGKILVGFTIPEGFKLKTDDPKDTKIQTAQTKTTKVEDVSGDDSDSELGDLGGARTTIGGVEYAVQYNLDGTVGLQSVSDYRNTGKVNFTTATPDIADKIKTQTAGQIAQLAYMAKPQAKLGIELAKKAGIKIPGKDKIDQLIKSGKDATAELGSVNISSMGLDDLTKEQMERFGDREDRFDEARASKVARDAETARKEEEARQKAEREKRLSEIAARNRALAMEKQRREAQAAKRYQEMLERQRQQQQDGGDDGGGEQSVEDQASVADQQGGMFTAKGSLITRKKPKTKKMKRGGLASK